MKFIRTSHAPVGASGATSGSTLEEDRKIFDHQHQQPHRDHHNLHRQHRWPPTTTSAASSASDGLGGQQHSYLLQANSSKSHGIHHSETKNSPTEDSCK